MPPEAPVMTRTWLAKSIPWAARSRSSLVSVYVVHTAERLAPPVTLTTSSFGLAFLPGASAAFQRSRRFFSRARSASRSFCCSI